MLKFILEKSLLIGASAVFTLILIYNFVGFSHTTADDSVMIEKFLYSPASKQVLGVSNVNESSNSGCPIDKPIIGWIDFRGNKLIMDNLPEDMDASSCFESIQQANSEGYFYKNN